MKARTNRLVANLTVGMLGLVAIAGTLSAVRSYSDSRRYLRARSM